MYFLTDIQRQVLNFVLTRWESGEGLPSCREIMSEFGWSSPRAATDVIEALKRKGMLISDLGSSRKYRLSEQALGLPILGQIPAGYPVDCQETHGEYFALNPTSFGVRDRTASFLLRVRGDSMIGRQIFDGDLVLVEKSVQPRHQDIVAALIDNESTLKTLIQENGKTWLRSENPSCPDPTPMQELQIQGIARAVIRPLKP